MLRVRHLGIAAFAVLTFTACRNRTWYRTPTGLEYKIIGSSKDSVARMGQTVKLHYIQKVGDSIIDQTYDRMPLYYRVMPGFGNRYNPLEIFDYGIKKGDSVITVQIVDSMMKKKIFEKMPPWMTGSDKWYTYMKVYDIFTNDSLLQVDKQNEMQRVMTYQTQQGRKRIKAYLTENKIDFITTGDTIFIQRVKTGNEILLDSGSAVKAIVQLQTLKGKMVNPPDTVSFITGQNFFSPPIEACLKYTAKGGRIRIYLPAVLIFGPEPAKKEVKASDDLILDMELVNDLVSDSRTND